MIVRKAAVEALGTLGDPRAVEPLIARLGDKYDVCEAAAEALGKIGAPAVEPLIARLEDKDRRWAAVKVLGKLGDARAVEPLIARLGDEYDRVRYVPVVVEALGKLGDARAVEPLIARLGDENHGVREAAAQVLVKMYRLQALDSTHEALILNQRRKITRNHVDWQRVTDCSHTDNGGIGVSF